jgi:hypothetical protein
LNKYVRVLFSPDVKFLTQPLALKGRAAITSPHRSLSYTTLREHLLVAFEAKAARLRADRDRPALLVAALDEAGM